MTVPAATAFPASHPVRVEIGDDIAVEVSVHRGLTFLIVEVPPHLKQQVVIRQVYGDRCLTNSN